MIKKFSNIFKNSVSRMSLDIELKHHLKKLKGGIVLDVGSKHSPYFSLISHKKYIKLDILLKNKPDICSDICNVGLKSSCFDTIIATEILEHIHDPQKTIDEIYRILKPQGICILSTRFIYRYHPDPKDYYRFSWDSLDYLFRKFRKVKIYHHGNIIQVLWQLLTDFGKIGLIFKIFNPLIVKIHTKKTNYPLGFIVIAIK